MFDSAAHRKIRLYVELGDDVDNTGHGTHTMGTLAGSPYDISNVEAVDYRSALAPLQTHLSPLLCGSLHLMLYGAPLLQVPHSGAGMQSVVCLGPEAMALEYAKETLTGIAPL